MNVADLEPEEIGPPRSSAPTLVSLHFLRSALFRRLPVIILTGFLGLAGAGCYLALVPIAHRASAKLILAHDPDVDSIRGTATDLSLLTTRTVADQVISTLGLPVTPEQLLSALVIEQGDSDVMELTLSAPTSEEAVRRLRVLTSVYLKYRADQLSAQSEGVINGTNLRIAALQRQVSDLTARINRATASGEGDRLSDLVSQRAQVAGQISTLQQTIQDTKLRMTSVVAASSVIDPAAAVPGGVRRRFALTLASGLIAATGLAVGLVLFLAITSDRLRRRADVAAALETSVSASTGRLAPLPRGLHRPPVLRSIDARRRTDRERFARAIMNALPEAGRAQWLAVACVDNSGDVRFGVAAAAVSLQQHGRTVYLTDLSEQGGLAAAVDRIASADGERPVVSRPGGSLAGQGLQGSDGQDPPSAHDVVPTLRRSDVSLVLADVDPSIGADHLAPWAEEVLVAVTAGRSSAERVRTTGDLVRAAGMDVSGAVMVRHDRRDESSGVSVPEAGR